MDSKRQGGDLFIVDNSDSDWKVLRYLRDWTELAHSFDVATGNFEIGSLLALDGQWQKLDKIRILMGGDVSKRTKAVLLEGILSALDASFEREKDVNPFLLGAPAIVEALRTGKIQCRVYTKEKFHAKAYITHAKMEVVGSAALVGSSNFTLPGLKNNVELNVQIRREVGELQEWYERHWQLAEDVTPEVLKVAERHTREYMPFDVYAKSLHELFRAHELTDREWFEQKSKVYPRLARYQKDGFHELMEIAGKYRGALLCDGVGLGKTFIGLMLIEYLVEKARQRVALFVPKAANEAVWARHLKRYVPHIFGDFSNLVVFNHTDLGRGGDYLSRMARIKEMADVVIIDEAHHFRNPGMAGTESGRLSRYRHMYKLLEGKTVFMLTATPVNNSLLDLQHMIELFTQQQPDYFKAAPLSIHSLPGHFRTLQKTLDQQIQPQGAAVMLDTNQAEAQEILFSDGLFRALVVQRSRSYVMDSQRQEGEMEALFPVREDPKVADYSLKKTYGRLLEMIEKAFSKEKPLFALAMYCPLLYHKDPDSVPEFKWQENRQKQVVALIRIQFLKRFESSVLAFEMSCKTLLDKLLSFAQANAASASEKRRLERWKDQNAELLGQVAEHERTLWDIPAVEDGDEDAVEDEMGEEFAALPRDQYKVDEMLTETFLDLDEMMKFFQELRKFEVKHDDKLKALVKLLKTDPVLKQHKVLVFSEFMATARYLKQQLEAEGFGDVDEVDSAVKRDRGDIIQQFAPYYNESSSADLKTAGLKETRVLISTDVLSEGLNLQDATRLINYDLHWNPVRLMQRIGRVDRRMNQDIERRIIADHPEQTEIRGKVAYWNFLPPEELDLLLKLYGRVSGKVKAISKVFGIEGRKLLKPTDDYEALKDFTHQYEGTATPLEKMNLEYQELLKTYPDLAGRLEALPGRLFSGKAHPSAGARGVFFCYAMPAPAKPVQDMRTGEQPLWTEEAGDTKWYLYDLTKEAAKDDARITDEPTKIVQVVRCTPETPRQQAIPKPTLSEVRAKVERYIKNTYLKAAQAPIGVKPVLKCWMELS